MKADFVGLGYCSNDHLAVLPFIPMDTKVQMLKHAILGGGPSANSTAGAAALGLKAAYIGTVGDDPDGRMILEDFRKQGVDTSAMKIRPGAKAAKEAGVVVNFDAGTLRDGVPELLPYADLLVCSEEFALKLTGLADAEAAVRRIYETYRPAVAGATMGVRGSMTFDGRDFVKLPAFPVDKVVDTTGCGDLYHTGFAIRWIETHDLRESMRFGSAVSALKCRGLSGRPPACPNRAEVEAFLAAHP